MAFPRIHREDYGNINGVLKANYRIPIKGGGDSAWESVAIQHDFGWRFSTEWGGDSARKNVPFRQVSVEISFDLARVAIQHGLKIVETYAKDMLEILDLHLWQQ